MEASPPGNFGPPGGSGAALGRSPGVWDALRLVFEMLLQFYWVVWCDSTGLVDLSEAPQLAPEVKNQRKTHVF